MPAPEIYFFLPDPELVKNCPSGPNDYWPWIVQYLNRPGNADKWDGAYNWTAQTYLYLRAAQFSCKLTSEFPQEGIIISHSDFLQKHQRPSPMQYIVEIKPDREVKNIFSQLLIVQNKRDPITRGLKKLFFRSAFIAHWPQPSLIPRDVRRGSRFENVFFLGNSNQSSFAPDELAPELEKIGLCWRMPSRDRWHDYSEADVIVALRPKKVNHLNKPATKLVNAWMAGVPAVLGEESAYQDLRKSELDYLEARDASEVLLQLKKLKRDPSLRSAMAKNGLLRSPEFSSDEVVGQWERFFLDKAIPNYRRWRGSKVKRAWFFCSKKLYLQIQKRQKA